MRRTVHARARVRPTTADPAQHYNHFIETRPTHLDLKQDRGLTIEWEDGSTSFYPVAYLRKMSPSADAKALRAEMARNPLTVLPASMAKRNGALAATSIEFVGNYAIRIKFSDGHETGIYSWKYLKQIDPADQQPDAKVAKGRAR